MSHEKPNTTIVLSAVASVELTPSKPTFANTDVRLAKIHERNA